MRQILVLFLLVCIRGVRCRGIQRAVYTNVGGVDMEAGEGYRDAAVVDEVPSSRTSAAVQLVGLLRLAVSFEWHIVVNL